MDLKNFVIFEVFFWSILNLIIREYNIYFKYGIYNEFLKIFYEWSLSMIRIKEKNML